MDVSSTVVIGIYHQTVFSGTWWYKVEPLASDKVVRIMRTRVRHVI